MKETQLIMDVGEYLRNPNALRAELWANSRMNTTSHERITSGPTRHLVDLKNEAVSALTAGSDYLALPKAYVYKGFIQERVNGQVALKERPDMPRLEFLASYEGAKAIAQDESVDFIQLIDRPLYLGRENTTLLIIGFGGTAKGRDTARRQTIVFETDGHIWSEDMLNTRRPLSEASRALAEKILLGIQRVIRD